jgi:hypothetical protein
MARTRLALYNEQGSPTISLTNCPVLEDIPISLTYEVADVRTPEKGKGSRSKTVLIPATQETNIFFQNIFNVNISLSKFNPAKKVTAIYYKNEIPQIVGLLRLIKIRRSDNGKKFYECIIVSGSSAFFNSIGGLYLTDLDFSEIDHTLNYGNIAGSWANTSGSTWTSTNASRAYPMINWGDNKDVLTTLSPKNFRLCLFARDILLKMFIAQGYTWESTFLDSNLFKRLIVTPTKGISLDSTTIANNKMLAVANGTEKVYNGVSLTYNTGLLTYNNASYTNVNFQSETYDTGNIFTTPNLTPATSNTYNTTTNIGLTIVIKKGVNDVSAQCAGVSGQFIVTILKGSAAIGSASVNLSNISLGSSAVNYCTVSLPNVNLLAATNYTVNIHAISLNMISSAGSGTYTMDVTVANGSNYSTEFSSNQAYDGISVSANNAIPENVKQSDFFSWICRRFHLFVMPDKNNPKNLIIEDRENFYLTTSKNWTLKHDSSIDEEIIPLGEFDTTVYKFTDKEDKDYFNSWHQDTYKNVYGSYDKIVTNDFVNSDKTISTGFSPTPYGKNPYSNILTAVIEQKQNGVVTEIKPNIRLLYYKQINLVNAQWTFTTNSGNYTYTNYPHAGHTDNPYNPTLDLNWGLPNLPYVYPNQFWTTNNAYNKYYSRYINQITDKNSKIVVTHFYLDAQDIMDFDFRNPIYYVNKSNEGAYYLVNKIIDYNPLKEQSTKVELLKLTNYDEFTPTDIDMSGGVGGGNNSYERVFLDNITKGDDNTNYGENSMIVGGTGNYIANG